DLRSVDGEAVHRSGEDQARTRLGNPAGVRTQAVRRDGVGAHVVDRRPGVDDRRRTEGDLRRRSDMAAEASGAAAGDHHVGAADRRRPQRVGQRGRGRARSRCGRGGHRPGRPPVDRQVADDAGQQFTVGPTPESSVEVDKMHPFGTVVLPRKSSVAGRPVTGLTSRLSLHEANSFTVDDIYSRQK
ncbi:unnamed protein product, partial [Fusarium equiseti]